MANQLLFLVSIALCCDFGLGGKLPESFKRCRVAPELDNKNNQCLAEAIEDAFHQLSGNGNSDLEAADLDPLSVARFHIEQGESSPITIKLDFTDNKILGVSSVRVLSVSGKLSSPKDFELKMKLEAELLSLIGPYKVQGKVLILPIQGNGESNMTMKNIECSLSIKGSSQMKDGKEYLKIKRPHLKVKAKRVIYFFGNLFNGNKALGDNTNRFLNDNWAEIFAELKESIQNAFSAVFQEYSKGILEKIPFNEIFLVD